MKTEVSAEASEILTKLLTLSDPAQLWVLEQFWRSKDESERDVLIEFLREVVQISPEMEKPLGKLARNRILDSVEMPAVDTVLLAALILVEDYECEIFKTNQVTQILDDLSCSIKNVTAALNGLIQKEEIQIVRQAGARQTGHKRYQLTQSGRKAAEELAGSRQFAG